MPDRSASRNELVRIIDESGADYLYPASWFEAVALTLRIRRALTRQHNGHALRTALQAMEGMIISTRRMTQKEPAVIVQGGKPIAVILPVAEYKELLERAQDAADLKQLKTIRSRPLKFRPLDALLKKNRKHD